jgi:MICOS complex subunit MIC60
VTYLVQSPTFLKSRSNSTKASPKSSQNAAPGPQGQPSQSGSNVSKIVLGTLVVGAAAMGAHQLGYIDLQYRDKKFPFSLKKEDVVKVYEDLKIPSEQKVDQTQNVSGQNAEIVQENNNEAHTPKGVLNDGMGALEVPINEDQLVPAEEKKSETLDHETHPVPDEHGSDTKMPSEDSLAVEIETVPIDANESSEVPHEQQTDRIDSTVPPTQSTPTTVSTYDHPTDPDAPKVYTYIPLWSLLPSYHNICMFS